MHDVVISGAGPAGSHCAKVLAEAGYEVALIEKDTNWRKPCGGAVSSKIIDLYPQIEKLNTLKITRSKLYSANFHSIERQRAPGVYSTIADRLEFDTLLRDIAIDSGAELFDKHRSIDFVVKEGKKVGIKTKSPDGIKNINGKILIIADGVSSRLAVLSGLRPKWKVEDLILGKCEIWEGKNNLEEDCEHFYFQTYKGYGWLFPLGNNRFNIGCGIVSDDNLKYRVADFYKQFINDPHTKKHIPGSNYKIIWSGACPIPAQGVMQQSLYGDNIMMIGDSAGFASPITGEGIYYGVFSGGASAEVAIESLEKEDYSGEILKKYKTHPVVKQLSETFKMHIGARNYFYRDSGKKLNEIFERAEIDSAYREDIIDKFFGK